jgi:hypothetical protein
MPRKSTLTEHTNAQTHRAFSAALKTLNQFVDPSVERRHQVLVDGVPLGARQNEIRKPGSSFYEQTFLEANAVAHLAVNLNLDRDGLVEVHRRLPPQPDIELTLNGALIAFVEETMVMDQAAHKVTLSIELLNDAIEKCEDAVVRAALEARSLSLRLTHLPDWCYVTQFPIQQMCDEIFELIRSLKGDVMEKVTDPRFGLLRELEAFVGYRARGKTFTPVSLIEHGRMSVLPTAFREQIRKKRARAASYPLACRPLWLLLDIEMHFGWNVDTDSLLRIIEQENPVEFDRIVIQQVRGRPLIIDFASSGELSDFALLDAHALARDREIEIKIAEARPAERVGRNA